MVSHINHIYANNRAEVSHEPTRTGDARVHSPNAGPRISDTARTHTESLSSQPPCVTGGPLAFLAVTGVSGLEGGRVRIKEDVTSREPPPF